ncbi:GAF domain-containing protein [Algoriphagus antarcticus]|uniref:GAF domain-containing protein n=1 Tax=Algoriphagus antarcticus TaxID=238540 RepID=UPI00196A5BAF|nr:GAF domain-containing protein [Algoriphagus antarcticus]
MLSTILEEGGVLIIPDTTKDKRFHDNPLATEMGMRFYAGAALVNRGVYGVIFFNNEIKDGLIIVLNNKSK